MIVFVFIMCAYMGPIFQLKSLYKASLHDDRFLAFKLTETIRDLVSRFRNIFKMTAATQPKINIL